MPSPVLKHALDFSIIHTVKHLVVSDRVQSLASLITDGDKLQRETEGNTVLFHVIDGGSLITTSPNWLLRGGNKTSFTSSLEKLPSCLQLKLQAQMMNLNCLWSQAHTSHISSALACAPAVDLCLLWVTYATRLWGLVGILTWTALKGKAGKVLKFVWFDSQQKNK